MQTNKVTEKRFWVEKVILVGILLLLPNSGYLIAFAENSFFYMLNVFLHVGLGLAVLIPGLIYGRRLLAQDARTGKGLALFLGHLGFWCCVLGVVAALYLTLAGNFKASEWILYAHVVFCFLGVVFLTTAIRRVGHQISIRNRYDTAGRWLLVFAVAGVCIPIMVHTYRFLFVHYDDRVHNPPFAPASMEAEAIGGAQGPFFPSSAATVSQDTIPASFLIDAEACGAAGCHEDIYQQWRTSPHRYSGFNNLWYQAAFARAEAQAGNTATKWCAGCHTPAALLNGTSNLPAAAQAQKPAAQAGVTCTACHAVVNVRGTMGQGGYVVEKPAMFEWLAGNEAWKKQIFAWFVHLDARPHRKAFLQPFYRNENGAFCSSCHKGHVDQSLNGARWVQVMNDYDSWQASSFGLGARDYQRAPERKDCVACHMPEVASQDASATQGKASDHRFLGGNTLLSLTQGGEERLRATMDYLREGRIALDIFAMSLSQTPRRKPRLVPADSNDTHMENVEVASLMKNPGEEWSLQRVEIAPDDADSLIAPLAGTIPRLLAGQSFRLDVVVRSRDIGHNFPAGAADMAQAWLELKIVDERGKIVFWSGAARGEGQDEVDPQAHVYGIHAVDSAGTRTFHPESWKMQAAARVNLLPPNGAEVVRYRVSLPMDCGQELRVTAKLNYRKPHPQALAWQRDPASPRLSAADSAAYSRARQIRPPIVEMAHAETVLRWSETASAPGATADKTAPAVRWQDYGVGLLRQHDVAPAERAFLKAHELAPGNVDVLVNLSIVKLRTGETAAAKEFLAQALRLDKEDARAHYYLALALKAEGDYRQARAQVKIASSLVRRDREFHLELARLHYLLDDYLHSKRAFKRVIHIDPEDPVIYQGLLRAYRSEGGKEPSIARAEPLLRRFSKDAQMQALTRLAKSQVAPHDTVSVFYHEYHSAAPDFWPEETASNGHAVSSSKK